jgi:hypothetical protein
MRKQAMRPRAMVMIPKTMKIHRHLRRGSGNGEGEGETAGTEKRRRVKEEEREGKGEKECQLGCSRNFFEELVLAPSKRWKVVYSGSRM